MSGGLAGGDARVLAMPRGRSAADASAPTPPAPAASPARAAADSGRGASKAAAEAIREMVLSGRLVPGDRVPPERELAQMFGFSRSSVREAVRELAALGVLTSRQGDGTYISRLESHDLFAPLEFALRVDPKSLLHLTELRLVLEPHVAATASAWVTPEQIASLVEALAGYTAEVESGRPDPSALIAWDEQIHQVLIDAADNPLIATILRSVDTVVHRGRELTVVLESAPRESLTELRALVDAVVARDPGRAESAMTWHVGRWAERIRHELHGAVELFGSDAQSPTGRAETSAPPKRGRRG